MHAPRACLRSRRFLNWRSQHGPAGRRSCYRMSIAANPPGHRSQTGARGTGCRRCCHGKSARLSQDAPVGAPDHSCFVSLRFTSQNDREALSSSRTDKVQDAGPSGRGGTGWARGRDPAAWPKCDRMARPTTASDACLFADPINKGSPATGDPARRLCFSRWVAYHGRRQSYRNGRSERRC